MTLILTKEPLQLIERSANRLLDKFDIPKSHNGKYAVTFRLNLNQDEWVRSILDDPELPQISQPLPRLEMLHRDVVFHSEDIIYYGPDENWTRGIIEQMFEYYLEMYVKKEIGSWSLV